MRRTDVDRKLDLLPSVHSSCVSVTMSDCRLFVARFSSRTRSRDLEDVFGRYGRLRDVVIKNGYGFVVRSFNFSFHRHISLFAWDEGLSNSLNCIFLVLMSLRCLSGFSSLDLPRFSLVFRLGRLFPLWISNCFPRRFSRLIVRGFDTFSGVRRLPRRS